MAGSAFEALSQETIDLTKAVFAKQLEKAITVSGTGLVGYNLEAPSKKLFPVLSPLRNRIPRTQAPVGSKAANWRAITGINTANLKAAVAYGTRSSTTITYKELDLAATYKSFGLDDSVDDESTWLGRGFEDVRALSALSTLQSVMIEEEKLILGGVSAGNALGTPSTPVMTQAIGGGNWGSVTWIFVKCVALPLYGYLNSNLADLTQALGDHSLLSLASTALNLTGATYTASAQVTPVNGAFAYAWFLSTNTSNSDPGDASRYLAAITTVPAVNLTAAASASNLAASTITADTSGDTNAFDGLFTQILNPANTLTTLDNTSYANGVLKKVTGPSTIVTGAIVFDMNVSVGAGSALTSDGAGGIVEFDAVLKALWDNSRIGPTLILMNSQEQLNVTKKIASSSGLGYRVSLNDGQKDITGGVGVSGYLNKFSSSMTPGNPDVVPFLVHPYLPPGTVLFVSERLPYPNNMVPNVWEMELQQEYADFEWARTQRRYEHGVYGMGVLKGYFPAGCAVIRSIKNG